MARVGVHLVERAGQDPGCLRAFVQYAQDIAQTPELRRFRALAELERWLYAQPVKLDVGEPGPTCTACRPAQRSRVWPLDGLNCWEATAHWLSWHLAHPSAVDVFVIDVFVHGQRHLFPAWRPQGSGAAPRAVVLQPPLLSLQSRPRPTEILDRAAVAQGGRLLAAIDAPSDASSPALFAVLTRAAARTGARGIGPWQPAAPEQLGVRARGPAYVASTASGSRLVAVQGAQPGSYWLYTLTDQPAQAWYNDLFGGVHWAGDKVLRVFGMGTVSDSISSAAGDSLPDWARTADQQKAADLVRTPQAPTPPTPPEPPTAPSQPPEPPAPPADSGSAVQTWVPSAEAPLSREERRERKWALR
ncbi:MAG: hypothetical protein U1A78_41615 [Polyangia bacterium]